MKSSLLQSQVEVAGAGTEGWPLLHRHTSNWCCAWSSIAGSLHSVTEVSASHALQPDAATQLPSVFSFQASFCSDEHHKTTLSDKRKKSSRPFVATEGRLSLPQQLVSRNVFENFDLDPERKSIR